MSAAYTVSSGWYLLGFAGLVLFFGSVLLVIVGLLATMRREHREQRWRHERIAADAWLREWEARVGADS
jgi:hypothetical protein